MPLHEHVFLFSSLNDREPVSARKIHIRRLQDILHLSLQRRDLVRAVRAWAILARCKEVRWKIMWKTGLQLLCEKFDDFDNDPRQIDFLRTMMLRFIDERESILQELVLRLVIANKHRDALDELELYLPLFPFHDNPTLHIYAAFIATDLAQPSENLTARVANFDQFDSAMFGRAQIYLQRAQTLDPTNELIRAFSEKLCSIGDIPQQQHALHHESEEEHIAVDKNHTRQKRPRKSRSMPS